MDAQDTAVRAYRTVREMLADRGVEAPAATGIADDEVHAMSGESATFTVEMNPGLVVVFHLPAQSIKKEDLMLLADGFAHIILVAGQLPSGASSKSINNAARAAGVTLEVFTLKELQFNVTRHELVPRHVLLTDEEQKRVVEKYRLRSRFQLQIILSSDKVARYLGLRHGDVVRVERFSPTAGSSVAYRCCKAAAPPQ